MTRNFLTLKEIISPLFRTITANLTVHCLPHIVRSLQNPFTQHNEIQLRLTIFVFQQMALYCIFPVKPLVLYPLYVNNPGCPQTPFQASLNMIPLSRAWTHTYQLCTTSLLLPVTWYTKGLLWN